MLPSGACSVAREDVSYSSLGGAKAPLGGAKASQHFSKCPGCQATQQIVAVLCVAHTISAPHHTCACCPQQIHAYLPLSSSHGPHSRSPSHASDLQHVTTCRACGSGAQWRPVISPFDCSVLSWRPIHPGQLKPTTLPLHRLAPNSCSVGLSPTLSLPFSPALSPAPHSLSLSSLLLLSVPFPLRPTLSLSLSLPLAQKRGVRVVRCISIPLGVRTILYRTEEAWCIHWATTIGYLHHVLQSFFPAPPCVSSPVMRIFFRMGVCLAACRGTAQRPRLPGPPA